MFDFGVAGYQPIWTYGLSDVVREHGHRLRGLSGRTLTRVWVVWDLQDDEWFCDCPVLFDFDGEQVEINHRKFDDLSLTWNTIDPTRPVRWPDFDLQWRPEPLPGLHDLRGLSLIVPAAGLRFISFAKQAAARRRISRASDHSFSAVSSWVFS
ncbi:hypothetical protein ACWGJW_24305, partial [Streptomyces nigrescens]